MASRTTAVYTPLARSRPQFSTPDASAASGSPVGAFGMEPNGTLPRFPCDFLDTSPFPLPASPNFLLPVADSIPRARATNQSPPPWSQRVAASDGSRLATDCRPALGDRRRETAYSSHGGSPSDVVRSILRTGVARRVRAPQTAVGSDAGTLEIDLERGVEGELKGLILYPPPLGTELRSVFIAFEPL